MEDNLLPDFITNNLNTHFIGQRVFYYPVVDSTMNAAQQKIKEGEPEGTVIIADEQTEGRGQGSRSWISPKGSLLLSIILYPKLDYLTSLKMLSALAIIRSIELATNLKAKLKWPNDILINNKKVSGILVGWKVQEGIVNYATIGIGINVNFKLSDFPQIQSIATSLSDESGKEVSRLAVLRYLLVEIEKLYLLLQKNRKFIYENWQNRLMIPGKRVKIQKWDNNIIYEGIVESITPDGDLLLRQPDGKIIKFSGGEGSLIL